MSKTETEGQPADGDDRQLEPETPPAPPPDEDQPPGDDDE